ncbi:hypothetical protein NDU88_005436 [Pleurodeles waltl]|uniref:Uncharacterized protein n=1 Tax=Pleurodeles waltl TaxID=8319 RepID=A0AAV7WBY3_PLEWA|nr:hypothetical protein NDU88_005436 [Pleurodeles waltl]
MPRRRNAEVVSVSRLNVLIEHRLAVSRASMTVGISRPNRFLRWLILIDTYKILVLRLVRFLFLRCHAVETRK